MPDRIRTYNLLVRSEMRYPLRHRHIWVNTGARTQNHLNHNQVRYQLRYEHHLKTSTSLLLLLIYNSDIPTVLGRRMDLHHAVVPWLS